MENEVKSLVIGGVAGGSVVGLVALIIRLLFAREKSEYERLEARIVLLEEQVVAERKRADERYGAKEAEHIDCIKKMGALEGRVVQLTQDMNDVIQRHDVKNTQQIIDSKEATIQLLLAKLEAIENNLTEKLDTKVEKLKEQGNR
jgi:BMFP domain-containing protein YqiC